MAKPIEEIATPAQDVVLEVVKESGALITPKRLVIAGGVALAVAGGVLLARKLRKDKVVELEVTKN